MKGGRSGRLFRREGRKVGETGSEQRSKVSGTERKRVSHKGVVASRHYFFLHRCLDSRRFWLSVLCSQACRVAEQRVIEMWQVMMGDSAGLEARLWK